MIPAVNLIPEGVLAQLRRRRSVRRSVALVLVGAGAFALSFAVIGAQRARAIAIESELDDLRAELRTARDRVTVARSAVAEAELETERARVLRAKRSWSGLLALITSSLPPDGWLTVVRTDPAVPKGGGEWRPPAMDTPVGAGKVKSGAVAAQPVRFDFRGPRALRIEGYAKTNAGALEFASNLKRFDGFREVTLEEASRRPAADGTYYKFAVTCRW